MNDSYSTTNQNPVHGGSIKQKKIFTGDYRTLLFDVAWRDESVCPRDLIAFLYHYTYWGTAYRCMEGFRNGEWLQHQVKEAEHDDLTFKRTFENGIGGMRLAEQLWQGPIEERIAYRRQITRGCAIVNTLQFVFPETYEVFPPELYHVSTNGLRSDIEDALTPRWIIFGRHAHSGEIETYGGSEAILRDHLGLYFRPEELRIRTLAHPSKGFRSPEDRQAYFTSIREAYDFVRS